MGNISTGGSQMITGKCDKHGAIVFRCISCASEERDQRIVELEKKITNLKQVATWAHQAYKHGASYHEIRGMMLEVAKVLEEAPQFRSG